MNLGEELAACPAGTHIPQAGDDAETKRTVIVRWENLAS
jgi:hypothetical protein